MRIVMNRRARLGIKVNLQARESDTLGAYVESVPPNGPAAKAGLRSGDIITKLDGKSVLAGGQAEQSPDQRQSLPGLAPGRDGGPARPERYRAVEYLRGKDRRDRLGRHRGRAGHVRDGPGWARSFTMQFGGPRRSHAGR